MHYHETLAITTVTVLRGTVSEETEKEVLKEIEANNILPIKNFREGELKVWEFFSSADRNQDSARKIISTLKKDPKIEKFNVQTYGYKIISRFQFCSDRDEEQGA